MGFALPKILNNYWFYFGLMGAIIFINYFWGKPLPAKKPSVFFTKHKQIIARISDIVIVCIIIFINLSMLFFPVKMLFEFSKYPTDLRYELLILFINLIITSGWTSVYIGLLSLFQKNISKLKRIFLLIICFLPVLFTVLAILYEPNENYTLSIELCLSSLSRCLLINGPAIILGIGFFRFCWLVFNKLRLISGEYIE